MTWVLVAVLIIVLAAGFVFRQQQRQAALDEAGPPGSRPRFLAAISMLIVVVAVAIARITDNGWWFLLTLPGLALAIAVSRSRRPTAGAE